MWTRETRTWRVERVNEVNGAWVRDKKKPTPLERPHYVGYAPLGGSLSNP